MKLTWTEIRGLLVCSYQTFDFSIELIVTPTGDAYKVCVQDGGGEQRHIGTYGGGAWRFDLRRAREACVEFIKDAKAKKPEPVTTQSGCKVGWEYFKTEAEAKIANRFALKEARAKEAKGYDFGYRAPGRELRKCGDNEGEYSGLWEIVVA